MHHPPPPSCWEGGYWSSQLHCGSDIVNTFICNELGYSTGRRDVIIGTKSQVFERKGEIVIVKTVELDGCC